MDWPALKLQARTIKLLSALEKRETEALYCPEMVLQYHFNAEEMFMDLEIRAGKQTAMVLDPPRTAWVTTTLPHGPSWYPIAHAGAR
jgi:hypothetical protein